MHDFSCSGAESVVSLSYFSPAQPAGPTIKFNSHLRKAGLLAQYSPDSRFFSRSCNATRDIFTYANQKTDTGPSPGAYPPNVLILADQRDPATIEGDIQMTMFRS